MRAGWASRVPGFRLPEQTMAVFQPEGGMLLPERCIETHVELEKRHGAEVRVRERVLRWRSSDGGVRVETERGVYVGARLVITAGPWAGKLVEALARAITPER